MAKSKITSEETVQVQVCNYIRVQYPKVLFNSDLSGIRLTIGQARKVKKLRSSRAFPDLVIYHPNKHYHALFLELKKDGTMVFKQNGYLVADEHIKEQAEMLVKLENIGYAAFFAVGFDEAKRLIDYYMNIE